MGIIPYLHITNWDYIPILGFLSTIIDIYQKLLTKTKNRIAELVVYAKDTNKMKMVTDTYLTDPNNHKMMLFILRSWNDEIHHCDVTKMTDGRPKCLKQSVKNINKVRDNQL